MTGTRFLCQGSRGQTGCIVNGMYPPSPHPMWRGLRASIGALFGRLPAGLLFVAVLLSAFSYGVATVTYEIFPYRHIAEGLKTYHLIAEGLHTGRMMFKALGSGPPNALHAGVSSSIAAREAAANRIELIEGDNLSDPVLWFGGAWQFTDVCPGYGCLAVAFDTSGKVAHAWPWRPHEIERAATSSVVDGGGAERALPSHIAEIVYPFAMAQYANGHLLVVLHVSNADLFFSLGLARIDADGYPVWYRHNGSHHWPQMLEDDVALVPGAKYGDGLLSFDIGQERVDVPCNQKSDYRYDREKIDLVNLIDGDGRLLRSLNLTEALLESDYALVLNHNINRPRNCNLLHLNFIRRIENDAGGVPGIMPGDLVASFRNLDAFAVIDPESGRIKRLVRGSFKRQHSVQHLEGSTFVMFDNQPGKGLSRLLAVDLATDLERTVFPNANTPANLHLYSQMAGHVSVSPDRRRAIVSYSAEGVALEVRLSDGAVLGKFTSLHDISRIDAFTDDAKYVPAPWPLRRAKATVFQMFGLSYIPPGQKYRFSRVSGEPAARGVWDVYLDDTSLTYHKQPCAAEDTASRFFLHVFPSNEADLPEGRELHGFDNRDFDFHGIRLDDGCFARIPLPDYAVGTMRTGQYIIPGQALWKVEIERRQEAETQ